MSNELGLQFNTGMQGVYGAGNLGFGNMYNSFSEMFNFTNLFRGGNRSDYNSSASYSPYGSSRHSDGFNSNNYLTPYGGGNSSSGFVNDRSYDGFNSKRHIGNFSRDNYWDSYGSGNKENFSDNTSVRNFYGSATRDRNLNIDKYTDDFGRKRETINGSDHSNFHNYETGVSGYRDADGSVTRSSNRFSGRESIDAHENTGVSDYRGNSEYKDKHLDVDRYANRFGDKRESVGITDHESRRTAYGDSSVKDVNYRDTKSAHADGSRNEAARYNETKTDVSARGDVANTDIRYRKNSSVDSEGGKKETVAASEQKTTSDIYGKETTSDRRLRTESSANAYERKDSVAVSDQKAGRDASGRSVSTDVRYQKDSSANADGVRRESEKFSDTKSASNDSGTKTAETIASKDTSVDARGTVRTTATKTETSSDVDVNFDNLEKDGAAEVGHETSTRKTQTVSTTQGRYGGTVDARETAEIEKSTNLYGKHTLNRNGIQVSDAQLKDGEQGYDRALQELGGADGKLRGEALKRVMIPVANDDGTTTMKSAADLGYVEMNLKDGSFVDKKAISQKKDSYSKSYSGGYDQFGSYGSGNTTISHNSQNRHGSYGSTRSIDYSQDNGRLTYYNDSKDKDYFDNYYSRPRFLDYAYT